MGVHKMVLSKFEGNLNVVRLVRGDANTQIIRMQINRMHGGIDLSEMIWSVTFENAAGVRDTEILGRAEPMGDSYITIDWIPGRLPAAVHGRTEFQIEGVATPGGPVVWRSSKRYIDVGESVEPEGDEPEELTALQQLIIFVTMELENVIAAGEAAQEKADAADAAAIRANAAAQLVADELERFDSEMHQTEREVLTGIVAEGDRQVQRVTDTGDAILEHMGNIEDAAEASAGAAATSAGAAQGYAGDADAARIAAQAAQSAAETAKAGAEAAEQEAESVLAETTAEGGRQVKRLEDTGDAIVQRMEGIRDAAQASANAAAGSESAAQGYAGNANAAKAAAEAAKTAAETAKAGAEAAARSAENTLAEAEQAIEDKTDEQLQRIPEVTALDARVGTVEGDLADTKSAFNQLDGRVTVLEEEPKVPETLVAQVDDNTRQIDSLKKMSKGILWDFQTDSADGDKVAPTGAKQASVLQYDGKSVVWNQQVDFVEFEQTIINGITITKHTNGAFSIEGTASDAVNFHFSKKSSTMYVEGHKYLFVGMNKEDASISTYRLFYDNLGTFTVKTVKRMNSGGVVGVRFTAASGVTIPYTEFRIYIIDLTAMGLDDIPSSSDPRIAWIEQYAAAHPEYNAGEIISADVESVTAFGRNFFDSHAEIVKMPDSAFYGVEAVMPPPGVYNARVSNVTPHPNSELRYLYVRVFHADGTRDTYIIAQNINIAAKVVEVKAGDRVFFYDAWANHTPSDFTNMTEHYKPMLTIGTAEQEYATYRTPIVRTIPAAVRALDGYGWSVGTARNYIEQTDDGKWLYHKNVAEHTFTQWDNFVKAADNMYYSSQDSVITTLLNVPYTAIAENNNTNVVSADVQCVPWVGMNNIQYTCFAIRLENVRSYFRVRWLDGDDDAETVKNFMIGKRVLVPVAETITDITDLMGNALDEFEVEAGGSISFVNDAMLAVPNTVQYLIALNEVVQ